MNVNMRVTNKDQIVKIYSGKGGFMIPDIAVKALNKTAEDVKVGLIDEMNRVFDKPTPYTLNALYIRHAKPNKLMAQVMIKDQRGDRMARQEKYLLTQVYGGQRKAKAFETALMRHGVMPQGTQAVPTRYAPLNQYGNVSGGFITQILSYFGAAWSRAAMSGKPNTTAERKAKLAKGSKRKFGLEYFAVKKQTGGLAPGIWRRLSFGGATRNIQPIFLFVKRPTYRGVLRWEETAERIVDRNWKRNLNV